MSNEFLDALESQATTAVQLAKSVIDEFCVAVTQYKEGKVTCYAEPGFHVNLGNEWKVVVSSAARKSSYVLLRAYVAENPDGFPVTLNLYDDTLVPCKDAKKMRSQLKAFLFKPGVRESIESMA